MKPTKHVVQTIKDYLGTASFNPMGPDFNYVLDLDAACKKLNEDYYEQNGRLYCWSESNMQFEYAWWHYVTKETPLSKSLKKKRPIPAGFKLQ